MTHHETDKKQDPVIIVRTIAAFLFFAAVIAFLTSLSLLFPAFSWDAMWNLNPSARRVFERLGPALAILLLLVGAGTCATAIGWLKRRKWAWTAAVALFAINGSGDVVTLIWKRDVLRGGSGILIAGVFLFFATRPRVRNSFQGFQVPRHATMSVQRRRSVMVEELINNPD